MERDITYSAELMENGVRHIFLNGTLDSAVEAKRGDALHEFVTRDGGTVLLDLTGLDYLSSGGMRVILGCAKALNEAGGQLHLAGAQPRVMSVLTIAGFPSLFPVYQSLEEAFEALAG